MSSPKTIQVYLCPRFACRYVEERRENQIYTRRCPKCGATMRHEGERKIEK